MKSRKIEIRSTSNLVRSQQPQRKTLTANADGGVFLRVHQPRPVGNKPSIRSSSILSSAETRIEPRHPSRGCPYQTRLAGGYYCALGRGPAAREEHEHGPADQILRAGTKGRSGWSAGAPGESRE